MLLLSWMFYAELDSSFWHNAKHQMEGKWPCIILAVQVSLEATGQMYVFQLRSEITLQDGDPISNIAAFAGFRLWSSTERDGKFTSQFEINKSAPFTLKEASFTLHAKAILNYVLWFVPGCWSNKPQIWLKLAVCACFTKPHVHQGNEMQDPHPPLGKARKLSSLGVPTTGTANISTPQSWWGQGQENSV